ncbi:hypothetical protein SMD22_00715 (plasmid) [Brevibacillus halotolerans]|nr:hypothetical protein SMD22_00715 [Brevibacillus halotolerans]
MDANQVIELGKKIVPESSFLSDIISIGIILISSVFSVCFILMFVIFLVTRSIVPIAGSFIILLVLLFAWPYVISHLNV